MDSQYVLRHGKPPVSFDHGSAAITQLLGHVPDVEAVFAVSDLSAVGVVMECQRRGLSVPKDISVMGFGDFEIGRVINPPLTTVHVDFHALGARAGAIILELLSNEDGAGRQIIDAGLSIVERASVASRA